jgi:hypothetical protein
MTSRQRIVTTLDHRQPDRVPLDLGGGSVTGIHCSVVAGLREHFGLEKRPVRVHEPYQMLGYVEADLKDALGVDVEGVFPTGTMFGFPARDWKQWRTPWGQDVLIPGQMNLTTTPAGDVLIYPQGDTAAPPSGQMPASGYFFDTIIRQDPIDDERLDVEENLEEFRPLAEATLAEMKCNVEAAARSGRAVFTSLPGTSLGDIARVPAPSLKHPRGIRDIEEWYMSILTRGEYVRGIFQRQVEIALANLARINDACGRLIDVVQLCGTDFGTQSSRFCSIEVFRDLWLPHYRRMTDWIHAHTPWKVFKHSCGAVEPLLESFIDAGFDILNPVQCSAAGMDPAHLKKTYGSRLVFWGGGIDTQHTLPFGTPADVREQTLARLRIFAPGGGFVFNTIHNIQARTPVANVIAMLDALREYNRG